MTAIRYVDVKELERIATIRTYDAAGRLLGEYFLDDRRCVSPSCSCAAYSTRLDCPGSCAGCAHSIEDHAWPQSITTSHKEI